MKKLLLTLIVALTFSGSVFSQSFTYHWPTPTTMFNNDPFAAWVSIDGVILDQNFHWDQIEVAAFVGEEFRGRGPMDFDPDWDIYPFTWMNIQYPQTGAGQVVTFQMYDHSTDMLYEASTTNIDVVTGVMHLEVLNEDYENAVIINFTSPAPQTNYWDEGTSWDDGVPTPGAPVVINHPITIRENTTVIAGDVTIVEGGSLTIEPGVVFYHTGDPILVTIEMDVDGYATRDDNPDNNGYRLFASPVYEEGSNPESVAIPDAMKDGDYDLYLFDQAEENEWRNYKAGEFSNLELMKGYLYAKENDEIVEFNGLTLPTDEPQTMYLDYVGNKVFTGWNLVGNPFTATAYIDRPFYVLNADGDEVELSTVATIGVMQGVFVEATGENDACIFSTEPSNDHSGSLNINLSQANTLADRAIVSFGSGKTLGKFQLNPNHTKVYFPQEGKDYAVVSAGEMGEMPVSFKAEKNGSYSLNFTSKEVGFAYLHLIDNKTGMDVDLLETPFYSFDALTTDYASRFKLVFATGNSSDDDSFAFNSNGNWIISNDGEAVLQVVDVQGRVMSSEKINGCCSKAIHAAPGVYMLRLINGDQVKVQKVVVK